MGTVGPAEYKPVATRSRNFELVEKGSKVKVDGIFHIDHLGTSFPSRWIAESWNGLFWDKLIHERLEDGANSTFAAFGDSKGINRSLDRLIPAHYLPRFA